MSSLLSRPETVLLTGATSGIGAELCTRLLDRGHVVIALARRASRLAPVLGLHPLDVDLADADAVLAAAETIAAAHPALSLIVNCAAVQHAVPLTDPASRAALLREEVAVNLLAPALLVQALLPALVAAGRGGIVNVSSGLAVFPKERAGLYPATKAGLSSFSTSLRWQVERHGIAVTEVLLPVVDTPMTAGRADGRKIAPGPVAEAILEGVSRGRPVIRVGAARLLPLLSRLAPGLGHRILRGT
jgi:short-subunit dehydrogenase involved in D-alanine esterification of teichoic acids